MSCGIQVVASLIAARVELVVLSIIASQGVGLVSSYQSPPPPFYLEKHTHTHTHKHIFKFFDLFFQSHKAKGNPLHFPPTISPYSMHLKLSSKIIHTHGILPFIMFAPDDTLYYQIKIPIGFWCGRRLNSSSLIQPSETLPIELIGIYFFFSILNLEIY